MRNLDIKKVYEWPRSLRMFVLSIGFLVIIYFGYIFDLSPMSTQIKNNDQQVDDLKRQLQSMVSKQTDIAYEVAQLPKLKKILEAWQQDIVDATAYPALIESLLKLGESNHVKFDEFNPGEPIKENDYTIIPVKIAMKGTYDQIATFLGQVANMKKVMLIDNLVLTSYQPDKSSATSDEPASHSLTDNLFLAQLTLKIYKK